MMARTTLLVVIIFQAVTGILHAHDHPIHHGDHSPYNEDYTHIFAVPTVFEKLQGDDHRPRVIITTSSIDPLDVFVTVEGIDFIKDATVSRESQLEVPLPTDTRIASPNMVTNKTIVVKASGAISVHCIENEYESGDGFLALPNSQLGTKYYVMSYNPFWFPTEHHPGFLCVTAIEDGTVVQIKNHASRTTHQIPMESWESYRHPGGDHEDLSGTMVTSNKPISVVSGIFTRVPKGIDKGADGLLEQVPPVDRWGTDFVLSPFLGRDRGYVYRVLAGTRPARVAFSNMAKSETIDPHREVFESHVDDNTVITITSDEPILVFQYMKSKQGTDLYEPSMMMVPPKEAYESQVVTFPVFECTFTDDFAYAIHVTTDCNYADDLMIDDAPMKEWDKLISKDKRMCVMRGGVDTGVHSVSHGDKAAKFTVAVYGIHEVSSYAYPAGYKPVKKSSSRIGSPAVVVGLILAAFLLLLLVLVALIIRCRRRRVRNIPKPTTNGNEVYTTLENQA